MSEEWAFCGRTKSTTRLNFDLPGSLSDNKFLLGSKARAEDLPAAIPRYSYVFVESLYYKVIQQGVINNLTHELLILDQKFRSNFIMRNFIKMDVFRVEFIYGRVRELGGI